MAWHRRFRTIYDVFECFWNLDGRLENCIENLILDSETLGFETIGIVKQGEALLLLGLAERLFEIQKELKNNISEALSRREALLRLVDPICLGDFKWFVFCKFKNKKTSLNTSCIR